jgi:protein SCO1
MIRMQRLFLLLTGVLLGGIVAGAFLLMQDRGGGGVEWSGSPLPLGGSAPGFSLLAHDGRTVSLEDFRGRVTVLFFGFTHCPDVCPGTMASLARAREQLGEAGDDLQVLFITVDPERDTPERLRTYLANFDPDFLGLTGDEEVIRTVADGYGAFFMKRDPVDPSAGEEGGHAPAMGGGEHGEHGDHGAGPDSGAPGMEGEHADHGAASYMVDHSGRTFVIDREGRLALTFQPWLEGEGMARDLARLLDR